MSSTNIKSIATLALSATCLVVEMIAGPEAVGVCSSFMDKGGKLRPSSAWIKSLLVSAVPNLEVSAHRRNVSRFLVVTVISCQFLLLNPGVRLVLSVLQRDWRIRCLRLRCQLESGCLLLNGSDLDAPSRSQR